MRYEKEEGGRGGDGRSGRGGVGGRGKPYGSSTNVLNYKSGGKLVDCQVGLQSGPPSWRCNVSHGKG